MFKNKRLKWKVLKWTSLKINFYWRQFWLIKSFSRWRLSIFKKSSRDFSKKLIGLKHRNLNIVNRNENKISSLINFLNLSDWINNKMNFFEKIRSFTNKTKRKRQQKQTTLGFLRTNHCELDLNLSFHPKAKSFFR